jgi:hypothetical protein
MPLSTGTTAANLPYCDAQIDSAEVTLQQRMPVIAIDKQLNHTQTTLGT